MQIVLIIRYEPVERCPYHLQWIESQPPSESAKLSP